MERALSAVISGGMSIRRAALEFSVPKSSLGDRVSGRVVPGSTSGPPRYLTVSEENELVKFLTRCGSIGYGKSRKEVMALVECILQSKNLSRHVSSGWWESFCRRHPNLSLRTAAPLSLARSHASDPDMISRYFDLLERTLEENDLVSKPGQLYNMDESGMPLDPKSPRVIVERGSQAVAVGSGNKSQVTIVGCVSAAGFCIPPMVIWDRKTLAPELTIGEIPGTIYGLSANGWMDMELFDIWFRNHFLRYASAVRPLLLLLDGHSSHYCPDTIRLAAQEKVILFTLPPNTTHLTQPLDKGCFAPLKAAWKQECHQYVVEHPGQAVTKFQFSRLFAKAWACGMTMSNIIAGFRVTGVYPLNRNAISLPSVEPESLSRETGIPFLPMCSPFSKRTSKAVAMEFTEEEEALFETRYENGYDIEGDARYSQWLAKFHPEAVTTVKLLQCKSTAVSSFLRYPSPPAKSETFKPKPCGRVLTSAENILQLEEKERKKKEKERAKQEREQARRTKALMKSQPG